MEEHENSVSVQTPTIRDQKGTMLTRGHVFETVRTEALVQQLDLPEGGGGQGKCSQAGQVHKNGRSGNVEYRQDEE